MFFVISDFVHSFPWLHKMEPYCAFLSVSESLFWESALKVIRHYNFRLGQFNVKTRLYGT